MITFFTSSDVRAKFNRKYSNKQQQEIQQCELSPVFVLISVMFAGFSRSLPVWLPGSVRRLPVCWFSDQDGLPGGRGQRFCVQRL